MQQPASWCVTLAAVTQSCELQNVVADRLTNAGSLGEVILPKCRVQVHAVLCCAVSAAPAPACTPAAPKIALVRTSPSNFTRCSNTSNVTLTYSLSSAATGKQFKLVATATNKTVVCTVTPTSASKFCVPTQRVHPLHATPCWCAHKPTRASGLCRSL